MTRRPKARAVLTSFSAVVLLQVSLLGSSAAATTSKTGYVRVEVADAGLSLTVPAAWVQAPMGLPDPGGLGASVFYAWDRDARGFAPNVQVRKPNGVLPGTVKEYKRLPWVKHPGTQYSVRKVKLAGRRAFRDDVRYGGLHRATLALQVAAKRIATVQVQTEDTTSGRKITNEILRNVKVLAGDVVVAVAGTIRLGDVPSTFSEKSAGSSQQGPRPKKSASSIDKDAMKIAECKSFATALAPSNSNERSVRAFGARWRARDRQFGARDLSL